MARKLRLQYAGANYHVINRGDRREAIFLDDSDRLCFLRTLSETCEKTGWQVHAYCLMGNHIHLVVETPQPNLVPGMKWLLGTYSSRFNRRHQYFGHVFSGRYKAPLVDGSGNGYLRTVCEYVHLNPVRAKLIRDDEPLSTYPWSSYPAYLQAGRPRWLRMDRVMGECGIPADTSAGRQRFGEIMEQRRFQADGQDYRLVRRRWCVGSAEFREELLAHVGRQLGPNHFGPERRESAEERAGRPIREALQELALSQSQIQSLPATNEAKLRLARRLRQETTMSLKWTAQQLGFSSWKYLSHLLSTEHTPSAQAELGL